MKELYGWITPNGQFVETRFYQHIEQLIKKDPNVPDDIICQYERMMDDVSEAEEDCAEEGGGWHNIEMWMNDEKLEITRNLYKIGYVRVGSNGKHLHFQGLPKYLTKWKTKCEDVTEQYGYDKTVFEKLIRKKGVWLVKSCPLI
jgi:hypothetical protein